jgi:hypothetical protein
LQIRPDLKPLDATSKNREAAIMLGYTIFAIVLLVGIYSGSISSLERRPAISHR